jgi:hypothetical protein
MEFADQISLYYIEAQQHANDIETCEIWRSYVADYEVTVFWGMTSCTLVVRYQYFRGTCCFHLQGRRQEMEELGSSETLIAV